MNEIATAVHHPAREVLHSKLFFRCCFHLDIWVLLKERQRLVLGIEHEVVGADLAVSTMPLQREEAKAIAMTAIFLDEACGLTSATRAGKNGYFH